MNILNQAMLFLLNQLHDIVHSYGLAIILLTVLVRIVLWPMNSSQTRNMRKMQELQPKLKALQEKHKDNPQKMQEQLLKFYAENKFNPMAGCLPMIIQIPIFIALYGAVNNPAFLAAATHEHFLFINSLSNPLWTHAGEALDKTFNVQKDDNFSSAPSVQVTFGNGKTEDFPVKDVHKALDVNPKPLFPGEPATFTFNVDHLGLSQDYLNRVKEINALIINEKSREIEQMTFPNRNGIYAERIPTREGKKAVNFDVLILIGIYAVFTLLYSKVMGPQQAPAPSEDPATAMQANMMKYMPLMFVVILLFIPLPAGVMLYLVVTTMLMFFQTWFVNLVDKSKETPGKPSEQIVDIKPQPPSGP